MKGPFPLKLPFDAKNITSALQMYVHSKTDKHVSQQIADKGTWEAYETQLLYRLLGDAATFVDVGANIGYYSVIASSLVGDSGAVFAFEPEQDNFDLLEKNIAINGLKNVVAVKAALSEQTSAGHIYLNEKNRGDHQIYQTSASDNSAAVRGSQPIQLFSGVDYFSQYKTVINHIDVLKIDTQGAEAAVIKGLLPLIKASLPNIKIILEFTPFSLRHAGASGMELLDLVASLSLPMQLIDHLGHKLLPITYSEMQQWILATDADQGNEGFINLLIGQL